MKAKKLILILFLCVGYIGLIRAQRYTNSIQLQSLTSVTTRPLPINTEVLLIDSSRIYLVTSSQPSGTSMATIIAAGEYSIISNYAALSNYYNISQVDSAVAVKVDSLVLAMNYKIDSLALALGGSSGSGITGADAAVYDPVNHEIRLTYDNVSDTIRSDGSGFAPPANADIFTETFNATGYDMSMYETVSAESTLDEDNLDITDPWGSTSKILKSDRVAPTFDALAYKNLGVDYDITYTTFYVYISAEEISNTQQSEAFTASDAGSASIFGIQAYQESDTLRFRLRYYNNGGDVLLPATSQLVLNTWHKISVKWDLTNLAWEWKINNAVEASGTLYGTLRTGYRFVRIGTQTNIAATMYYDNVYVNSTGYSY